MEKHSCTIERFRKDTADHAMTVLRDEGLYRHLCFERPGTNCYRFDMVTWPGYLAISGDMGEAVFTRIADMFEFFRAEPHRHEENSGLYINSGYWAEKCAAIDSSGIRKFDEHEFRSKIRARFDDFVEQHGDDLEDDSRAELWSRIEDDVLTFEHEHEAFANASNFEDDDTGFRFDDLCELNAETFTFRFIWKLYAISHGIRSYDEARIAAAEEGK